VSSDVGNTRIYLHRTKEPRPALCAVFNPIQVSSVAFELIAVGAPDRKGMTSPRLGGQSAVAGIGQGNVSEDLGEWVVSARQSPTISPLAMTILLGKEVTVE
jgi:hypothetical protein